MGHEIAMTGVVCGLFFIALVKIIDKAFGEPGFWTKLVIIVPLVISLMAIPIGLLISIWG